MSEYKPIQNSGTIINAMTNNVAQIIFFITISSPFCIVVYAIFFKLISHFYFKIFYFFNQINWSKKLPQISIEKAPPNSNTVTNAIVANIAKIISFKTIFSPFCIVICVNFFYCINYPKNTSVIIFFLLNS